MYNKTCGIRKYNTKINQTYIFEKIYFKYKYGEIVNKVYYTKNKIKNN